MNIFSFFSKNKTKGEIMKKILYPICLLCLCFVVAFVSNPISTSFYSYAVDEYSAKSVVLMDAESGQILYEKEKRIFTDDYAYDNA